MRPDDQTGNRLEGRLLAQRAVLARFVCLMPEADRQQMLAWLDDRQILRDGQEDPGAVPVEAAAPEFARSDEFRLLRQLIDETLAAPPHRPAGTV